MTERFFRDALHLAGVPLADKPKKQIEVSLSNEARRALRQAIGRDAPFRGRFELPVDDGVIYLSRTHPIVEGLASYVLDTALDEVESEGERVIARRSGATKTKAVNEKAYLLLVRFSFHLLVKRRGAIPGPVPTPLLAEEIRVLAFHGTPTNPTWISDDRAAELLDAAPSGNLPISLVKNQLQHFIGALSGLMPHIDQLAVERADALADAHTRVRRSANMAGKVEVVPVLPGDILGSFILLPDNG